MADRPPMTGKTLEWRRDPRPDEDDMALDEAATLSDLHPERPTRDRLRNEKDTRTAYDVKGAHRLLRELPDDTLKQIPVLPQGAVLEQGATYIDLHHLDKGEFVPTRDVVAGHDTWFVPKSEVGFQTWNLLRRVDDPERLGKGDTA